jgi:hypothetical protein
MLRFFTVPRLALNLNLVFEMDPGQMVRTKQKKKQE